MFRLILLCFVGMLPLVSAPPQNNAAETTALDSCAGKWHLQKDGEMEIVLEKTGDSIHLRENRDGKVRLEYTCKPDGKDCDFREEGHKGKVSLWFNGPYLVELRSRGGAITKRRLRAQDNRDTLQVEVMPMSPPGKTEMLAYSRLKEAGER